MKRIKGVFGNYKKVAMERILLFSLRFVIEELIMRIREYEDPMFSGEYAKMDRKELELVATAFIRDQIENLNGFKLCQYLADVRYLANPKRDLEEIQEDLMYRGNRFDDYDFDGYEGDEGA
jgi:hypothetical protein